MRSSLPQIFRKDIPQYFKPEKQSSQFSLYLRTNNFKPKQTFNEQNRYSKTSSHRMNKSMDNSLRQTKNISFPDDFEQGDKLKSLLSHRNKFHSKSLFIQQKQNDNIQQVDNFKTIRKRVLQQLSMLQKSIQVVDKMQNKIRQDIESYKNKQIEQLQMFESQMYKKIFKLKSLMKTFRKQTNLQIKVNKEQLAFLQQEVDSYKQIYKDFQVKQNIFRFQFTNQPINIPNKNSK